MSKKNKGHSKIRALERYGIALTNSDLQEISKRIRAGKSTFIKSRSARLSIHEVTHRGVVFKVLYDRNKGDVVTFLN